MSLIISESLIHPLTITPLQLFLKAFSASMSPKRAQFMEALPSITMILPVPSNSTDFFTNELSSKQLTVKISPKNTSFLP